MLTVPSSRAWSASSGRLKRKPRAVTMKPRGAGMGNLQESKAGIAASRIPMPGQMVREGVPLMSIRGWLGVALAGLLLFAAPARADDTAGAEPGVKPVVLVRIK